MAVIAREFRLFVRYTMLSVALKLVFSSDCSTDQLGMQSICFALLCTLVFLNILEGQFSTRFLYGSVPEDWRSSFSNFFSIVKWSDWVQPFVEFIWPIDGPHIVHVYGSQIWCFQRERYQIPIPICVITPDMQRGRDRWRTIGGGARCTIQVGSGDW